MCYRICALLLIVAVGGALFFPDGAGSQVVLYIGDGSGDPGSCATPVGVSLQNPTVRVKGISMDICEVNNTLVRLGCDTTERAPAYTRSGGANFNCISNELSNGCVRILLYSGLGNMIDPGSGPVFYLKYGVFEEAGPAGSCIPLQAENVLVAGERGPLTNVGVLPGQFCYYECSVDEDCADTAYCNGGETCVTGVCQAGANPCPDDGLFCTGVEGCDEEADACTQSGDPCKIACDEDNDVCLCSVDDDCDDGLFCNGAETCNGTFCLPGTNPCPSSTICDETDDRCVECVYDSECSDGLFCNGVETCVSGSCQAAPSPCPPLSTCDEEYDVCRCTENAQCNDGLYCNGVERCLFNGTCDITFSYFSDYPCRDCNPQLEDCDCNEAIDACVPVTLSVGNGSGLPGTTGNAVAVSLDTLFVEVNTIQADICDADNYLTCTGCSRAGRTPAGFSCLSAEQLDGCCRITLINLSGGVIKPGSGPIFNVAYSVRAGAPLGECRALTVHNETVATSNVPLDVNTEAGRFCFQSGPLGASAAGASAGGAFLSAGGRGGGEVAAGSKTVSRQAAAVAGDGTGSQDGGEDALTASAICPIEASVDDREQLRTLRRFRDTVLSKHVAGRIFIYLFYRNALEMTELLGKHDNLREQVRMMVDEYGPLLGEAADGGTACLGAGDEKSILAFLQAVKHMGSDQLKEDIDLLMETIVSGNPEQLFGIRVEK